MCVLEAVERGHQKGSQLKLDGFGWAGRKGQAGEVDESKEGHSLAKGRLRTVQESHTDVESQDGPELVLIWAKGAEAWVLGRGRRRKVKVETESWRWKLCPQAVFLFPPALGLWPALPHAS